MKSEVKLLAITGSHRANGNSYYLAKSVLESVGSNHEIVQLADKKIEYCTLCGQCLDKDCALNDDLAGILQQMRSADGIVFTVPKYLLAPSKFLALLERLDTIVHMRRHKGYEYSSKQADYRLFADKAFCIMALSGTGSVDDEILKVVAGYIEELGLKPVSADHSQFPWVSVKSGDRKGEVLENMEGRGRCIHLVERLVQSLKEPVRPSPEGSTRDWRLEQIRI